MEDSRKIYFTKLSRIKVENGDVLHALKSNENSYKGFKEAYFSTINSGKIKAWKRHLKMTMNLIVPKGKVGFVFYDPDANIFKQYVIGEKNYGRITVKPGIWFGFKGLDISESFVLNIANILHDYDETERINLSDIHYKWGDL